MDKINKKMNKNEKRGWIIAIIVWVVTIIYFVIAKWKQ